jgi:hypothetical protein
MTENKMTVSVLQLYGTYDPRRRPRWEGKLLVARKNGKGRYRIRRSHGTFRGLLSCQVQVMDPWGAETVPGVVSGCAIHGALCPPGDSEVVEGVHDECRFVRVVKPVPKWAVLIQYLRDSSYVDVVTLRTVPNRDTKKKGAPLSIPDDGAGFHVLVAVLDEDKTSP